MKTIVIAVMLCLSSSTIFAASTCDLVTVVNKAREESYVKEQALLMESMNALNVMSEIAGMVPDKSSKEPLINQLSPTDNDKLSRAKTKYSITFLAQIVESRRQRDLDMIVAFAKTGENSYRFPEIPKEGEPGFMELVLFESMKDQAGDIKPTDYDNPVCNIERALYELQLQPNQRIDAIGDSSEAMDTMSRILKKNKLEKVDFEKISSKKDRDELKYVVDNYINPILKEYGLILGYEYIKYAARASEITYASDREDVTLGAGDLDFLGKSLAKRMQGNEFDKPTKAALATWRVMNKRIMSSFEKAFEKSKKD